METTLPTQPKEAAKVSKRKPRRRITTQQKWQRLRCLIEEVLQQRIVIRTDLSETLMYRRGIFTVSPGLNTIMQNGNSNDILTFLSHDVGHWLVSTPRGRERKDFGISSMSFNAAQTVEVKACYAQRVVLRAIGAETLARQVDLAYDRDALHWWLKEGKAYVHGVIYKNIDPHTGQPTERSEWITDRLRR